jgi:hypothetical protein
MSESNSSIDAVMFDRLVDGELDRRAQAELLSRLDENPSDWRRLALAFVEAQAFGAELRGIAAERPRVPSPEARPEQRAPQLRTDSSAPNSHSPWSKLLSLAATMLLAVGIGFGVGRVWQRDGGTPVGPPTNGTETVDQQDYPEWPQAIAQNPGSQPQGMMTVQAADGSPVELPVYEASYGTEKMLSADGTSVPPEVIRALRSRGHEVKQQRRLWPIDLGDGRQIIVPVDQVDVQYVGDRAYQ